jgi:hypothetical protein
MEEWDDNVDNPTNIWRSLPKQNSFEIPNCVPLVIGRLQITFLLFLNDNILCPAKYPASRDRIFRKTSGIDLCGTRIYHW